MKKNWVIILFLMIGCSPPQELIEEDLVVFLLDEKNGLMQVKQDSDYTISITFRPSDFIAMQQMSFGGLTEYDSLRKIYSDYMYFVIDISRDGKDLETIFALKEEDFASRISFLSSGFSEKFSMNLYEETLAPQDYVYTRSYGNASSRFLVAFKRMDQDMEIVIDGFELGFGKISFPFQYSQINKTPKLKLKQA